MSGKKINVCPKRPRILVAPLEWGLGHATRCIPIISELLALGCEVLVAAGTAGAELLKKEFPDLRILPSRGYRMTYSRKKYWLPLKLLVQLPKVVYGIFNEHRWLKRVVREEGIDAVISDNRFGLYHGTLPSIYITHQLAIETGNTFANWVAQRVHYYFINRYTACWIPDEEADINLAGKLSHPHKKPTTSLRYLGPLSRFEKMDVEKKYDLLVCLSGPEPQRTLLEDMILADLLHYTGKAMLVRGLPGNKGSKQIDPPSVEVFDHLPSQALGKAVQEAKILLCRSGYTTVMDLVKLDQKAILIPTPGQKEQEYLSRILMEKQAFFCMEQHEFFLSKALDQASKFSFNSIVVDHTRYKRIIAEFVFQLKADDR